MSDASKPTQLLPFYVYGDYGDDDASACVVRYCVGGLHVEVDSTSSEVRPWKATTQPCDNTCRVDYLPLNLREEAKRIHDAYWHGKMPSAKVSAVPEISVRVVNVNSRSSQDRFWLDETYCSGATHYTVSVGDNMGRRHFTITKAPCDCVKR